MIIIMVASFLLHKMCEVLNVLSHLILVEGPSSITIISLISQRKKLQLEIVANSQVAHGA
jgi:hypothetical protein